MASSRQLPTAHHHHHHLHVPTTNDDLEFQESDLYFNDSVSSAAAVSSKTQDKVKLMRRSANKVVADESRSVPVGIPVSTWSTRMVQVESEGSDDDDEEEDVNGERVPPHEYLARKRGASLSVHEGVGRTLKGRDMSRVRNAVWKRIGFED